jgi:adenylate cyclase
MQKDSRIIAAILAADVVEYSRLMATDEPGTLAALKARRSLFADQVAEFGGHEFGSVGDSLMARFPSAVNAVAAALSIQEAVAAENAALPAARRMMFRVGVNLGDVIEENGGFFGDAVNVAARLQALAKPGGVMVSGSVYDQVHARLAARYVDAGTRQVRNIREPVRTFEVLPAVPAGIGGRIVAFLSKLGSRRVLRGALVGVAVGIALALGLFWRDIPVPATDRTIGTILQPESVDPSLKSLAVLPFVNMTGDPADDYLGDGFADDLQNRLSRVPGLRVAARRSAFSFKGKDIDVRDIAAALDVNYVVEGSIRRQGGLVRVNAALVDRATGANRWSNSYERPGDFLAIEEEVGRQVLTALELVLGAKHEAAPAPAGEVRGKAYDLYLQGLSYLRKPKSPRTLDSAERLFLQALDLLPELARAQAGLCETRVERFQGERVPGHVAAAEEACVRAAALDSTSHEVQMAIGRLRQATGDRSVAVDAYRRALELAPHSPDALIGLATALAADGQADEAERTYLRAIAAQPSYAATHMAYGDYLFSSPRAAEAAASYERAARLTPGDPTAFSNLGASELLMGNFDKAADAFARSLALDPRGYAYANLGSVEYYRGRYAAAAAMYRKAAELAPDDHRPWGNLADAQLYSQVPEEALKSYRRALDLVQGELAVNPRSALNHAQAAYYASRLGEHHLARRHAAEAASAGEDEHYYVRYYLALTELGLGNRKAAIEHLDRSRELGFPEVLLRNAPELGPIKNMS